MDAATVWAAVSAVAAIGAWVWAMRASSHAARANALTEQANELTLEQADRANGIEWQLVHAGRQIFLQNDSQEQTAVATTAFVVITRCDDSRAVSSLMTKQADVTPGAPVSLEIDDDTLREAGGTPDPSTYMITVCVTWVSAAERIRQRFWKPYFDQLRL